MIKIKISDNSDICKDESNNLKSCNLEISPSLFFSPLRAF